MQLNLLEEKIRERLQERARLIGRAPENDIPRLESIFEQVAILGQLLHEARQFLEVPLAAHTINSDEILAEETVWLWERGLALPNEVESGAVSALVRQYVDQMLQQQQQPEAATHRLSFDIHALNALLASKEQPQE